MLITWSDCLKAPEQVDRQETINLLSAALETCCLPFTLQNKRDDQSRIESLFSNVLIAHYGNWVKGWCYSAGDGGFVKSWCCPSHSILPEGDSSFDSTIERVADSVTEWHQEILNLTKLFARLDVDLEGATIDMRAERASVTIVNHIVEINNASDAWYYTFQKVLTWYLEKHETVSEARDELIERICEGRFSSWIAPTEEETQLVSQELGRAMITSEECSKVHQIDTTAQWRMMRVANRLSSRKRVKITDDIHFNFIVKHDSERSIERGEAMKSALTDARRDAGEGRCLNWELLCEWQKAILQLESAPRFRQGDAFAKSGRERYPLNPGTFKQFRNHLAEANDPNRNPVNKAALIYFDICFFHPFEDGNARLARIALDYVLTKNGLGILLAEPIFKLSLSPRDFRTFQMTLDCLVGEFECSRASQERG